jgi:SHS2 domain-containing protein
MGARVGSACLQRYAWSEKRWERFAHEADIGVRGLGASLAEAYERAALALTAVITELASVRPAEMVELSCEAPGTELLFAEWLNPPIYQMATRQPLFARFEVEIAGRQLRANA